MFEISQESNRRLYSSCCECVQISGNHYHRVAGEGALQLEDFMEASSLSLPQLLFCHLDHKAHCGVSVVVLVVCDERRNLLCAIQHRLQHILLVSLDEKVHEEFSKRVRRYLFESI